MLFIHREQVILHEVLVEFIPMDDEVELVVRFLIGISIAWDPMMFEGRSVIIID